MDPSSSSSECDGEQGLQGGEAEQVEEVAVGIHEEERRQQVQEDQEQADREQRRQGGIAAISGLRGQRGGGGAAAAFDEPPLPSQQSQEDHEQADREQRHQGGIVAEEIDQVERHHQGQRDQERADREQGAAERAEVGPRVAPVVPQPCEVVDDGGDGWGLIKQLGAWNCIIPQFGALEEVPAQHVAVWCWAWGEVLKRVQEAEENSEDLDLALMWFLFLPQALCRKPEGRGGIRGRGFVNKRFGALAAGKWGELVRLWQGDVLRSKSRKHRAADGNQGAIEGDNERKRREVLKLLGKGQIHRAVDRINSFGVADLSNPEVKRQVLAKHPPRWKELVETVEVGSAVDNLHGLKSILEGLKRGGSPGSGGLRAEYLVTLARNFDVDQMRLLEEFGLRYLRGQFPA